MKIEEYTILEADSLSALSEDVNKLIISGWVPQGGISYTETREEWENERKGYTESDVDIVCAQAMIKYSALREGS